MGNAYTQLDQAARRAFDLLRKVGWEQPYNSYGWVAIDPRDGAPYPPKQVLKIALNNKFYDRTGGDPTNAPLREMGVPVLPRHVTDASAEVRRIEMTPLLDHMAGARPNIFLKGYNGWDPEGWGGMGFTYPGDRANFLNMSRPGALVIIYGTGAPDTPADMKMRVLGAYQVSHESINLHSRLSERHIERLVSTNRLSKWIHGVPAIKAWSLVGKTEVNVRVIDVMPNTWKKNAGSLEASRRGIQVSSKDIAKLRDLYWLEEPVFGESFAGTKDRIAKLEHFGPKPSNAVGAAEHPFTYTREPPGPKRLYVLKLTGNVAQMCGLETRDVLDKEVYKVGFSMAPYIRRNAFNKTLPGDGYLWTLHKRQEDWCATQKLAIVGEDMMKQHLKTNAKSLGFEFFLSSPQELDNAWNKALESVGQ